MKPHKAFLALAALALAVLTLDAQSNSSEAPPVGVFTAPTIRPMAITGQVLLEDDALRTTPILVEATCGERHMSAYTTDKGRFSFQMGWSVTDDRGRTSGTGNSVMNGMPTVCSLAVSAKGYRPASLVVAELRR